MSERVSQLRYVIPVNGIYSLSGKVCIGTNHQTAVAKNVFSNAMAWHCSFNLAVILALAGKTERWCSERMDGGYKLIGVPTLNTISP